MHALGFSQGTTQIYALIANDYDYFKDRIHKAALFSPCYISENAAFKVLGLITTHVMDLLGIKELGGPTWYKTAPKLAKIFGRKMIAGLMAGGWGVSFGPVSTKTLYHYSQNRKVDRFQMWSDDFWNPLKWERETELLDLSTDKSIPFGLFAGELEDTCLLPMSERVMEILGDMGQFYKVYPGETHGSMGFRNDPDFYNDVLTFLTSPDPVTHLQ